MCCWRDFLFVSTLLPVCCRASDWPPPSNLLASPPAVLAWDYKVSLWSPGAVSSTRWPVGGGSFPPVGVVFSLDAINDVVPVFVKQNDNSE